jgi:glycosyltransferase involved in cell wall biosynthesis
VIIDVLGPVAPYRGGIAHYTTRLTQELRAQGHNVRVLNLKRQYPATVFPGTTQLDESDAAFAIDSVRCLDSLDPRTWLATANLVRARRTDLLIIQWWHSFFAPSFASVAAAARACGTRVVFLCHNALPHEPKPWDRLIASATYRLADYIVVHAESERHRVHDLAPRTPVRVHPHPVYDLFDSDESVDKAAAREKFGIRTEFSALFFGLIRQYKGVDLLIEAMGLIPEHVPLSLRIVGESYEDATVYEKLIAKHDRHNRITFVNRYLANDEVPWEMAAADVVVLPYRHATQSGIVQIAYACDRPVITTAVGGLPDVVDDGISGRLVAPESPQALADALVEACDQELLASWRAGLKETVKRFTWASMAETITG